MSRVTECNLQGVCPVCGSKDIAYEAFVVDDYGGYYPAECIDCHATFEESYEFKFTGHYNVVKHY